MESTRQTLRGTLYPATRPRTCPPGPARSWAARAGAVAPHDGATAGRYWGAGVLGGGRGAAGGAGEAGLGGADRLGDDDVGQRRGAGILDRGREQSRAG